MKSQRKRSFRRNREVRSVIKVREKEEIFEFFFFLATYEQLVLYIRTNCSHVAKINRNPHPVVDEVWLVGL